MVLGVFRGKKRREVEVLLSRVTPDGQLAPREGVMELRLKLKESEREILSRAREVLAAMGKLCTRRQGQAVYSPPRASCVLAAKGKLLMPFS